MESELQSSLTMSLNQSLNDQNDNADAVLAEATLNAGKALGLRQDEIAKVIGRDRSRLRQSIKPDDKTGELALLLVRVYRSLYALVDGNPKHMKHWMHTLNHGTRGIPREQVLSVQGLSQVVAYLDAIRGKV